MSEYQVSLLLKTARMVNATISDVSKDAGMEKVSATRLFEYLARFGDLQGFTKGLGRFITALEYYKAPSEEGDSE